SGGRARPVDRGGDPRSGRRGLRRHRGVPPGRPNRRHDAGPHTRKGARPAQSPRRLMAAGYSGTPLAKKLGIKSGDSVALLGSPTGFQATLEGLPDDARVRTAARGTNAVVVSFHTWRADLDQRVDTLLDILDVNGGL